MGIRKFFFALGGSFTYTTISSVMHALVLTNLYLGM